MESNVIVQIAVIGAFGLIGLGILSMIVSGIKSLVQGKQDVKRIVIMNLKEMSLLPVPSKEGEQSNLE